MLKLFRRISFKLLYAIRSIHIQTRLIGSFFMISLIPLLVTGVLSYSLSSSAIKTKISTYAVQIADQVSKNISRDISRLEFDSVDLAISEPVQNTLTGFGKMSEYEKYSASRILQESIVKKFSFLHYISDVLLYTNTNDRIIAYGDSSMFSFTIEPQYLKELLRAADEKNGAPIWTVASVDNEVHLVERPEAEGDKHYGILVCRSIKDLSADNQTGYHSIGERIGYIIIRANEKYISDIYRTIDIGLGSDIFVVDSRGIVISSRNTDIEITKQYKGGEIAEIIKNSEVSNAQIVRFQGDRESSLIAFSPIENTDWFVVSVVPFSYLNRESVKIGKYTILVSFICIIAAVLFSLLISKSISIPLKKLVYSMNSTRKGILSPTVEDNSKDEIAEVSSNYNDMLNNITILLKDVKNKERQKRSAELKALQAQINPHFLSNTLNTAKWLAGVQNANNVENLLTALVETLHASMDRGSELITLEEEIHYLKNYIYIQEYKYCDKFKVHFEIPPETMNLKILKFLLQPLVENSIIHGIEPLEGTGVIIVKAVIEGNTLKIRVTDNGVGISEDLLKKILYEDKRIRKSMFSGIGVPNVEERIKLYFGDDYGIHIESVPFLFTTFELTLPIVRESEENDA